jgi:hypothetical protein
MSLHRALTGTKVGIVLLGAAVAFVSPSCEEPDATRDQDAASDEPPPQPTPQPDVEDEDDDDARSRTAGPGPAGAEPACHVGDWHSEGHCLAKCKGDGVYGSLSDRRSIDYKWCYTQAWKHCGDLGMKLHEFCWGEPGGEVRDELADRE